MRASWAVLFGVLVAVPAAGRDKIKPPPGPPFGGPVADPALNYVAPKGDGPVVELLDENLDPLLAQLIQSDNGSTATREDRDTFAGVEAARVTPMQRYNAPIAGWDYRIVEKPAKAGEFRYLRFAWKKLGGTGIMVQLHDPAKTWFARYYAGSNVHNWQPAAPVNARLPAQWEVVTRDLFKEHGAFTLTGFALTPFDGEAGLFDHVLLGRTVEDLDRATATATGRDKPAAVPTGKERDALWADLMGEDRTKAAAAQRTFLQSAKEHVAFAGEQLGKTAQPPDQRDRVKQLIEDLDADAFDTRDRATDELVKVGAPALDAVRELARSAASAEAKYRAHLILRLLKATGAPVSSAARTVRALRVLERAATPAARDLLTKLAAGDYGFEVVTDAKAALARLPK